MIQTSTVTVGSTATLLLEDTASGQSVVVTNEGTSSVYLGESDVTTSTGFEVPTGESYTFDQQPGLALYGIRASLSEAVGLLYAQPFLTDDLPQQIDLTDVAPPPAVITYPGRDWAPLFSWSGWETLHGYTGVHNNINPSTIAYFAYVPYGRYSDVHGDYVQWNVWLEPGTYEVDSIDFLSSHFGVGSIYVDGVWQFDVDQSATGDHSISYLRALGSFTVSTSGLHTVRYFCNAQAGVHSVDHWYSATHCIMLRGGRVGLYSFMNPLGNVSLSSATAFSGSYAQWSLMYMAGTGGSGTASALPGAQGGGTGADVIAGDGTFGAFSNGVSTPYCPVPGATGNWVESRIYLDAGTYVFDYDGFVGTTQGVLQLKIDGTAVGTPQAAGTLRNLAAQSANGNGNNGGGALTTGMIDCYDSCSGTTVGFKNVGEGGTNIQTQAANALTGIVVASSGWKTVRLTTVGSNSSMLANKFSNAMFGWFRRTA